MPGEGPVSDEAALLRCLALIELSRDVLQSSLAQGKAAHGFLADLSSAFPQVLQTLKVLALPSPTPALLTFLTRVALM